MTFLGYEGVSLKIFASYNLNKLIIFKVQHLYPNVTLQTTYYVSNASPPIPILGIRLKT